MRIVDVLYSYEPEVNNYDALFEKHAASIGHHQYLSENVELYIIRHFNGEGMLKKGKANYYFFKGSSSKFWLPINTNKFIKKLEPHLVIVHGFKNPLQVLLLKLQTGATIILQDHGGNMPSGFTGMLQERVNRLIDNYLFTAVDQASVFKKNGFIPYKSRIFEVLEASTYLAPLNKQECKNTLGLSDGYNYLWVGRFAIEKDPVTVVKGFEKYLEINPTAMLYMIYQETPLLPEITNLTDRNKKLGKHVKLIGKINHQDLAIWYSAADFFVSGSYREGSGYALIEALHCGCIPVVTNIPSFKKITNGFGVLFDPGDVNSLLNALCKTMEIKTGEVSKDIVAYAEQSLSFKAIADDIYAICTKLA